jgi:hypothetical protein
VRIKEAAGLLQLGVSDDLTSIINSIDVAVVELENVRIKELAALSHAAGFYNPKAILNVDPEPSKSGGALSSVKNPVILDLNSSLQSAVARSAELLQILSLIQLAKHTKIERIYSWLDPSADTFAGLGPSYPFYLEVSQRQIDEMIARKEQLKSVIFNKVSDAISELDTTVKDYDLALQSREIQERRVIRISQNIKVGIAFAMSDLVFALQDKIKADLNIITAEYGYLISLSRVNRLLYQGPYSEGLAEKGQEP